MHKRFFGKAGAAFMAAAMALNGAVMSITPVVAADEGTKYELENATLTGDVTTEKDSKASGGSVAYMTEGGSVDVEVEVPSTGMYTLTIYALGVGGNKIQNLSVNGVDQGQISIPESKTYDPIAMTVKLNEGKNTVSIIKSWGWTKFDYMTVTEADMGKIEAKQTDCCDIKASAETRSLMAYLSSVYGNNIISGQQEIYSGGPHGLEYEFEYLEELTGHMPAIRGFDYGNFCCPCYGSDDGSTDRIIDWVNGKNGIATASFHLNVPKDFASYTLGSRLDWAATTYGAKDDNGNPATDFSAEKAATEGTKENKYYLQSLEILAKEFNKLEEKGIPVIWRPLHEAEGSGGETGSWFWWGKEGSEVYKKLWIYTYKTLTETYNCHNLIWEWNSYNYDSSADWYPGDEYVDIIGYDKYNCTVYLQENNWAPSLVHNDSAISATYYGIMSKYDSAKMVSMAENDCFSTVDNLISEKAGWLYFCTWYDGGSDNNNFLTNPMFNTKEDTIAMYQSDYCITLDELPADLYKKDVAPIDPALTTTKATTKPTTTTTAATTEADPNKNYGKVVYNKTKDNYQITLPKASPEFYLNIDMPKELTYANGGMGVSIEMDGTYYWANLMWEAKKPGEVKVDIDKNFLNCSIGTDVVEDEEVIAAVKAKIADAKVFEGQIWYAAVGEDEADKSGVKIVDAYLKKDSSSVTTPAPTDEPVGDIVYGDANLDGVITIADATAILQHCGNKDKYGLEGQAAANADCYDPGSGISAMDALAVQKVDAKILSALPEYSK